MGDNLTMAQEQAAAEQKIRIGKKIAVLIARGLLDPQPVMAL
jgi:hypothetical protein